MLAHPLGHVLSSDQLALQTLLFGEGLAFSLPFCPLPETRLLPSGNGVFLGPSNYRLMGVTGRINGTICSPAPLIFISLFYLSLIRLGYAANFWLAHCLSWVPI